MLKSDQYNSYSSTELCCDAAAESKVVYVAVTSAGTSLNEPPPPNYNWPLIFWRPFFSRHPPEQQPSYRCSRLLLMQFHLQGPFT